MPNSKNPDSYTVLVDALNHVRKYHQYNNKWMTVPNWGKLIKRHYPSLTFSNQRLSSAIGRSFGHDGIDVWRENEKQFYATKLGSTKLYCSMTTKKKPNIPPALIDKAEVLSFDAETGFQNTRKRPRVIHNGSKTASGAPLRARSARACRTPDRRFSKRLKQL